MGDKVYTISELNRLLKKSVEGNPEFTSIWIKGEISNVTYHSSGHIYFSLKDEGAVLSAVFFKYANRALTFRLEEGMSLLVFGSVTVFEKRGSYQFIVAQLRLEGVGELQKRIDQLKKKLMAEGLFDPARRRKLPFLPKRIGVVTSPTGAAIRDIIKVALRRFPNLEIVLAPAIVQGAGAVESIVRGIEELNRSEWNIDVILCGRGGGSFEDLMAYNEEPVVRAFAGSRLPIVSAVGHQVDHPLSDDAADYAAPTPSAAAEIAVQVKSELVDEIDYLLGKCESLLRSQLRERLNRVQGVSTLRIFRNPREIVDARELLLSDVEMRMLGSMKDSIGAARARLLVLPDIARAAAGAVKDKAHRFGIALAMIQKLSPLGVLARGYAIARNEQGAVVRAVGQLHRDSRISLHLHDGVADCTVNSTRDEVTFGKKAGS
ncbi:MAG: exodeoxyribonuclease VII large subunit [Spirochaetes bacterium]|nr:MAG: exodeoxyribonuclease VII large subunit [Spirochaetota bacterium]